MSHSLKSIFEQHNGHLIHKWEHYFAIYERYFEKYRDQECSILEIGISHGGSLQMWRKYFGPKAKIYAIDVNPECKKFQGPNIKIFIGSQSDTEFLEEIKKDLPKLDIIIDDGGHTMKQQIISFEKLYAQIKDNGIYLCEDTHSSYWFEYGGGFQKKGTFIEYCKSLIDQLNAWHIKTNRKTTPDYFTKHTESIHFYDSIVVFLKSNVQLKPFTIQTGAPSIKPFEEPEIKNPTFLYRIRIFLMHYFDFSKKLRR